MLAKTRPIDFSEPIAPPCSCHRSTLADANERRDWRVYAELAQRLIARARTLYAEDSFGVDLTRSMPRQLSKYQSASLRKGLAVPVSGNYRDTVNDSRCVIALDLHHAVDHGMSA